MFLTNILRKGISGRQWIGKYRRPRVITWCMKKNLTERLAIEAETEYWISRPYMTKDQEFRHAAERRQRQYEEVKAQKRANFPPHKYLGEHLNHLNTTKKWTIS
ncbi:PREDICTED: ribosomal protein 63, mitochondrial [Nanorana parkeri]|uniref:ribosomal protein 63, mitochondrial n=1 Tax=Nanorana parkeri TaxID=125878 RepID=UPI0008544A36|nr:PREDICTED: ribosomal protein 63, mitochondrial [Nanorana parkeri]